MQAITLADNSLRSRIYSQTAVEVSTIGLLPRISQVLTYPTDTESRILFSVREIVLFKEHRFVRWCKQNKYVVFSRFNTVNWLHITYLYGNS